MKKCLAVLAVSGSMLAVVLTLSAGVAAADHTGGTEWTCDDGATEDGEFCENPTTEGPAADNALEPVGRHIFAEGAPGTPGQNGNRNGISNNPLCPLHGVDGP